MSFYLVDKANVLVKESESKISLRRTRRKQPKASSLRILEGRSLKKAIESEEKKAAKKEVVAKVEATAKVKKVRKSKKANK